jgi:hypothetical protein
MLCSSILAERALTDHRKVQFQADVLQQLESVHICGSRVQVDTVIATPSIVRVAPEPGSSSAPGM